MPAHLRLVTMNELFRHSNNYGGIDRKTAEAHGVAGHMADTISLQALSNASNVELRIWAYATPTQQWKVYLV